MLSLLDPGIAFGLSVKCESVTRALKTVDMEINCWIAVVALLSRIQLFATPWTVARQAPLSMGFSRPEYWSGLACPSPEDLSDPGLEPGSPALQADSLPSEIQGRVHQ